MNIERRQPTNTPKRQKRTICHVVSPDSSPIQRLVKRKKEQQIKQVEEALRTINL